MAQTKVVIVYSPGQARCRTIIKPDDDSQIPIHANNLLPGEAALVADLSQYNSLGADVTLAAHLGRAATTDRCIVVAPNAVNPTVLAVVCADPAIDTHPLGNLMIDVTGQAWPGLPVVGGVAVIPFSGKPGSSSSSRSSSSRSSSSRSSRSGSSHP